MTNSQMLKEKICNSGISITYIAEKIGISRESFYKKLNNKTEFKASEMTIIKEVLNLSVEERDKIFFNT
ncbi:MAG: helix-turn-helix transcriptional regulator [Lachnospiraceae bacterium]|nr:helix-turn-helix transcriptional regulator [Lachnospiraceae bacterium]